MKNKAQNIVALDLGSSKIAAFAAQIELDGRCKITNQLMQSSQGIKSSSITNIASAENAIINTIYNLEKDLGRNISKVSISLSGGGTKSLYTCNKININGPVITEEDVKKLIHHTLESFKPNKAEIIHYFPLEFTINDNNIVDDPVGMVGSNLECRMHIITAETTMLLNIANCLAKYQIEISEFMLGSHASSNAVLTEDEKEVGCIAIDMGARTSSLAILYNNKLVYTTHVPIGGAHITSDISKAFSLPIRVAEKIKILYGAVSTQFHDKNVIIDLEDLDIEFAQTNEIKTIEVSDLIAVIRPRVQEICELLQQDYNKLNIDNMISRKIVITGGGAMLRGIKEIVGKTFNKNVRIANPHNVAGCSFDNNPGILAVAIGMIINHAQLQQKIYQNLSNKSEKSWSKKIFSWLKENI